MREWNDAMHGYVKNYYIQVILYINPMSDGMASLHLISFITFSNTSPMLSLITKSALLSYSVSVLLIIIIWISKITTSISKFDYR